MDQSSFWGTRVNEGDVSQEYDEDALKDDRVDGEDDEEMKMSMKMKKMKRVARRREKVTMEKNMARRNTMEEMTKHPMIKRSS